MNTVDKGGANLTPLLTVSGNFKNAQSILTPIVIIYTIDSLLLVDDNGQVVLDDYKRPLLTSRDASKEIIKANYCYIDELQRYYFISDIQVVNNDLVQLYLKEDVLYTYANQIKEHTAYISRNEFTNTPLIEDRNEQLFYDKEVSYKDTVEITGGEAVNFAFNVSQLGTSNIIFSALSKQTDYRAGLVSDNTQNKQDIANLKANYTEVQSQANKNSSDIALTKTEVSKKQNTLHRHTIEIVKDNEASFILTTENTISTEINTMDKFISAFKGSELACMCALNDTNAWNIHFIGIQVGTTINDTSMMSSQGLDTGITFTDVFGTSGYTMIDKVKPL